MNLKHIRNLFLIFIIALILYSSYVIIFNDITLKKETASKSILVGKNEKITTLKLGISEFDTFNPILTKNKDVQYISKLVYDSLFTISENYKIQNLLATECTQISEKSYIIKLRKEVYWSDGQEFSAEDVIYTIEKIKSEESIYTELVGQIESMQIIDKYTIKINLYEETSFFEYNLIFSIVKNNSKDDDRDNIGMYHIHEINENKIILSKNEKWWNKTGQDVLFENIIINLYSNKFDEYKAFKNSKIDIINTNSINYEEYIGKYGYNVKNYVCPKHTFLAFNTENEFLSNLKVRQAIDYAIDKQTIVSNIFDNKYVSSNFPLDYGNFLYTNKNEHIYSPREAGLILNGQFEDEILNLDLVIKKNDEKKFKTAELIKSDLANIGININIVELEENEYRESIINKDYDILLCTIDLSLSPSLDFFVGEENIFGYKNSDNFKLINEIKNIKDEELLKEKYSELVKIYFDDIAFIGLYNNVNTLIYSESLRANIKPNYYNIFYGIEKWYSIKPTYLG